jgi:hypothetical protein
MINVDEKSNAQSWELEVTCKNKIYLDAVVSAILKYGMIEFEVNLVDVITSYDGIFDGRYTVFMWCSWFNNLKNISKDLAKIEKDIEP